VRFSVDPLSHTPERSAAYQQPSNRPKTNSWCDLKLQQRDVSLQVFGRRCLELSRAGDSAFLVDHLHQRHRASNKAIPCFEHVPSIAATTAYEYRPSTYPHDARGESIALAPCTAYQAASFSSSSSSSSTSAMQNRKQLRQ
jgi:hypothetical protein